MPQDLVLLLERAVHANTVQQRHSDPGTRDFGYTMLRMTEFMIKFHFVYFHIFCFALCVSQVGVCHRATSRRLSRDSHLPLCGVLTSTTQVELGWRGWVV